MGPAFTKGPWRFHGDDDRVTADIIPIYAANGHEVGEVYGWETNAHPTMTIAEAEANARLIAAAPDLYEQLLEAERLLGNHSVHEDDLPPISAALAKARGDA